MLTLCSVEAFGCRLRPVTPADAVFITGLRAAAGRTQFLRTEAPALSRQREWIVAQQDRPGDFYFIVESVEGRAQGTIGIYQVAQNLGRWGRWALLPSSLFAAASLLLLFDMAFVGLRLSTLFSETERANRRLLGLKERLGHVPVVANTLPPAWNFDPPADCVVHRAGRESWSGARHRLVQLASRVAVGA